MPDELIPVDFAMTKILQIRGQKVMIAPDLAELYGVETRRLNEQVKRNIERFPEDFMFQLSVEEFSELKNQLQDSSWGGRRTEPYAFTEQGIAMLSSVLNSDRAIKVNIAIMRAFVEMRQLLSSYEEFSEKLAELEEKYAQHDEKIRKIFEAIYQLMNPEGKEPKTIDFKTGE